MANGSTHDCQKRKSTRGEDLVCLSGGSCLRLWATAAIVKWAQIIFWHACSAVLYMNRAGSSTSPKYVNSSTSSIVHFEGVGNRWFMKKSVLLSVLVASSSSSSSASASSSSASASSASWGDRGGSLELSVKLKRP